MASQTKEELLQYFSGLNISTLQKLQKYSKLLIIPDEDLLVNATMIQMVEKGHNLADALFPEWTDRSKSDFGEFLLELFAVFSEKDFWYINAFANEGILKKMRSYSNAFSKASSMGYQATLCKGASATFGVTFVAGEQTTYERGDLVVEVEGIKFTNDASFTVEKSADTIVKQVTLSEGSQVSEDVTYNGYSIFIRKDNIDIDSIKVTIDNIIYSRVRNFGFSEKDSTHYMVLPEEDGSCSIYFGSNGFGLQPSLGKSIRVEYRRCSGNEGNTEIKAATINDSYPLREAIAASMSTAATGGVYAESLTSIKERAPLYFYTKQSALNESISETLLNSFSFVHKSKVTLSNREVNYYIIPTSGLEEPSASELQQVEKGFYPYLMTGYSGLNRPNVYRNLITTANPSATKLIVDIVISSGYDKSTIEGAARQIMSDITSPLVKATYGGSFLKTDADILMRSSIAGVQSVTFKLLVNGNEEVMPDVVLSEVEIFRTINQDNVTVRINVV